MRATSKYVQYYAFLFFKSVVANGNSKTWDKAETQWMNPKNV